MRERSDNFMYKILDVFRIFLLEMILPSLAFCPPPPTKKMMDGLYAIVQHKRGYPATKSSNQIAIGVVLNGFFKSIRSFSLCSKTTTYFAP